MSNIREVTDLAAPELAVYTQLTRAQLQNRRHPQEGVFIAESVKVIEAALLAGYEPVSLLAERRKAEGLCALFERWAHTPIYTADRDVLAGMTGYALTRGVLCAMKRKALREAADVCQGAHRIAVLCGIVDTTNMGAIFRSAAALHMDAVLLDKTCCDPLSRRALRVSMGTVFKVPWAYLPEAGMDFLGGMGFKTAAMALTEDAVSIEDLRLKEEGKLAIVLGTEGDGLAKEAIARCDYTVKIPMSHEVDSLNVAAASAVAFWELRRR